MKVDYKLIRSERKSTTISVERDRSVVVRAPWNAPEEAIIKAVDKKKFWIYQKTNHPQKYHSDSSPQEFISGTSVLYLGRNYRMEVVETDQDTITFRNKFIVPAHLRRESKQLFERWYIEKAHKKIVPKVDYYAEKLGVVYNKAMISDMKVRWGSCTPKDNLNFNWRLIKAPMYVIDYVIVHELAHLLEANHTERFWNIVRVQSPRYEKSKNWLKDYGHILERDV